MTYEELLAQQPTLCGDRDGARAFVALLLREIERGTLALDFKRRGYLKRLIGKWTLRADGNDERWRTHGMKAGRPRIRPVREPTPRHHRPVTAPEDDDDLDAISRRILTKYGSSE